MTSRATAVPLLVVAATYAVVGPSRVLGLALIGVLCVFALLPRRLEVGRASQILLMMLLFGAGIALGTSLFAPAPSVPPGMLRLGWSVSVLTLLLVAIGRLSAARPLGGDATTLAIGLGACAATGGAVAEPLYPVAVVAFLVSAAWALGRADPIRAARSLGSKRRIGAVLAAVVLAVGSTVVADASLPRLHSWMVRQIMRSLGPRTGFATRMSLGSLSGLWESDEVVLRIRGADADYLRGAVFDSYQAGRWATTEDDSRRRIALPETLSPGAGASELELVGDEPEHYFLPLEAGEVAVPTGLAAVDGRGLYAPLAAAPSALYSFRPTTGPPARLEPPRPEDAALEPALAARLAPLASRWTEHARTSGERLSAIAARLRTEYRYSLEVPSPIGDPVEHFLLRGRAGHCEYFASAMALLARTSGIPARVVAGYRAVERNELGGHLVVRERHAHAWVEAWLDGAGWQTFDPTPAAALDATMPGRTPLLSAVGDLARAWWAAALRWLDRRTPLELAAALIALVLLAVGARALRALLQRGRAGRPVAEDPPPAYFDAVARALGRHGIARAPHEPLEVLDRRLADRALPAELQADVRAFLSGYAAYRYGGLGDRGALERSARALLARLAGAGARTR